MNNFVTITIFISLFVGLLRPCMTVHQCSLAVYSLPAGTFSLLCYQSYIDGFNRDKYGHCDLDAVKTDIF